MPNLNALVALIKSVWAAKVLQQNPPVLSWECLLKQVVPCNGRETVAATGSYTRLHNL